MSDLDLKVTNAQHRIEDLYHATGGHCYHSFSGGKDSTVILSLIKQCQELGTISDIPAVFSNTGIELRATVDFVNWVKANWYPSVEIIRPEVTFDWVLKNKGKPMVSKLKSDFLSRYQRNTNTNCLDFLVNRNDCNYHKTKLANKHIHLLHPDFDIKISNLCCHYLKKEPFEIYNKEHDIKGYITGERMAEGGIRQLSTEKRIMRGGAYMYQN